MAIVPRGPGNGVPPDLYRLLIGLPLALVALLGGVPLCVDALARATVLPKLTARLGRNVSVADMRVGWSGVELRGLVVDGGGAAAPVVVPRARVDVAWSSLFGALDIDELELYDPRLDLVRGEAGEDNVSSLLAKWSGGQKGGGTKGKRGGRIGRVKIHRGVVRLTDATLGQGEARGVEALIPWDGKATLQLGAARLEVTGGSARADAVTLELPLAGGRPAGLPTVQVKRGTLTPLSGLELTGIRAQFTPSADGKRENLEAHGSFGGAAVELWNATGAVDAALTEGTLSLRCDRFRLSQLDAVLRNRDGSPELVNASNGAVDARLDLGLRDGVLSFSGGAHVDGLTVAHPGLGPEPLPHLSFDAQLRGTLHPKERTLQLTQASVDFHKLHAQLTADVANLGRRPRFAATFTVRPLPCQTTLEAFPVELVPQLRGFRLGGTFSTELHLSVDLGALDTPVDLGGHVGIEGCSVLEAPAAFAASRLQGSFPQTAETEAGRWLTFYVGPESPTWAPFAEISPHLVNSIMTTEDNGFFHHHGFIRSEFRSALQQNLQRGYFRLGASSITMQMVKNVLLSREKTLSRKLQEMFLTWYLERQLSKERIMEIYFNVIEFGPGIYGIGRAAKHYFNKSAKDLEPQEAAWFSSILPNPKRRYVQFCHANGLPDAKWDAYVKRIMRRMHERGRLTDEEFQKAMATPLRFARDEARPERECLDLVKRVTTPLAERAGAAEQAKAAR